LLSAAHGNFLASLPDIQKLYDEQIVHRTEPFTEPQVEAVNP
jgi:hypothetical protein